MKVKLEGILMEIQEVQFKGNESFEFRLYQRGEKDLVTVRAEKNRQTETLIEGEKVFVEGRVSATVWRNNPQVRVYAESILSKRDYQNLDEAEKGYQYD